MKLSTALIAVLTTFAVFLLAASAIAAIEGDAELLRLVAEGQKANRERLETWAGKASVADVLNRKGIGQAETASVRFVYDPVKNRKRWNWQNETCSVNENGHVRTSEPDSDYQETHNAMIKDGLLYRYGKYAPKTYAGPRILYIDDPEKDVISNLANDFDPFFYLTDDGSDFHPRLMFWVSEKENPALTLKVSRSGDVVTCERVMGDAVWTYKFDVSRGCNLVEAHEKATTNLGRESWDRTWEWASLNGVFIPSKVTRSHTNTRPDGTVVVLEAREIAFEDMRVNEPLDESEFSLASLGIVAGDTVQDHLIGAEYTYRVTPEGAAALVPTDADLLANSALVDTGDAKESAMPIQPADDVSGRASVPPPAPPARCPYGVMIVTLAGVLACAALVIAVRMRRKQ